MHVDAKKTAFGGLLLALSVLCIFLGNVIETNTLFLLALASYFVGIVYREFGKRSGAAFYLAGVFLGFLVSPDKFYVISYAGMAFYILFIELCFEWLKKYSGKRNRIVLFWIIKYIVFNLLYISALIFSREIFLAENVKLWVWAAIFAAGQVGLFLYDRGYEYVQGVLWNRLRNRMFHS